MKHIYIDGIKHTWFAGRMWTNIQIDLAVGLVFIVLAPALFWLVCAL